ncbi:MAG TPA: hypothetical protein VIJ16_00195 [Gemmatimonadaceae bacterium]
MRARLAFAFLIVPVLSARAQRPVLFDTRIQPETVTVGQPFVARVHVLAPAGASIVFPDGPDSLASVQLLDPRALANGRVTNSVDLTATYRLAAWDVGTLRLALPDVIVHFGTTAQRVPLGTLTVFVKSVLPVDTALREPKPARDLLVGWAIPWWILAVLGIIAFLIWLAWRRQRTAPPQRAQVTPFERAEREFTRVAALGLVEAGERGRYVALVVEVLRDYLNERFALASLALTSDELVAELRGAPSIPLDRLARLLHDVDFVKFARRPLSTEQALVLGREARGIVAHEHVLSEPPAEREAA